MTGVPVGVGSDGRGGVGAGATGATGATDGAGVDIAGGATLPYAMSPSLRW